MFHSPDVTKYLDELLLLPDGLLMGRETYEGFATIWTTLRHGLVHELGILVFPFAFGEGPRLFERMGVHPLKLLDTKIFESGVVALHYEPRSNAK